MNTLTQPKSSDPFWKPRPHPDLTTASRSAYWALMIAIECPRNQGTYSSDAKISWETVHEIRNALDAVQFDWRTACQTHKAAVAKSRYDHLNTLYPERKIKLGENDP